MKPSLIPLPNEITYINGCSRLTAETPVFYDNNSSVKPEGYSLSIDNNRVLICSSDERGKFYAQQTLKQIIATCSGECDNLIINDYPEFSHRGVMVDCARHFFTVDELKKVIDSAAYSKMNVFHWHLTDDQGWRLPIKKHPMLTEIGGHRKTSLFGKFDEGKEYTASFTADEIREIIDYCSERYIEVIPEIDMPGHTTSILAVYPELGCTGEKIDVQVKQGIFDTVLCLGNPDSIKLIHEILDEVCELFPGRYIHIGGDETPRTKWKNCPKCNEKMKELGTDDYDKLQGYFIKEIADYLKSKGKETITWNESLKGDILNKDDILVHRWMDKKDLCKSFTEKGGKIIQSDFFHYYCDYPYGMTPVKKTYDFRPVDKHIAGKDSVAGVEAELWTEYIRSFDDICFKLYPRMFAVAEAGWSRQEIRNYKDFKLRHENLRASYEEMGLKVPSVDKWGLSPISRLSDMWKFFRGSIDFDNIRNSVNN